MSLTPTEMDRIVRVEVPYVGLLGVRFEYVADGRAAARIPFSAELIRPGGTISGPALVGLADVVIYACVLSRLGLVKLAVTSTLTANFLRRPAAAEVRAEGRLLRCGRRLAYGEVTMFSGAETDPVCHVTATYAIPPAPR